MRIYFTGAHGIGKTTLCRYVSKKYKLPMLPEVARIVLAERELSIDTLRVDLDTVDQYQTTVLERQFSEEKKNKSFVSDRAFDALAYAAQHSRILNLAINSQALKDYILTLTQPDVCIFFVRPSKATLKQDGVRETLNWDGVVAIDAMIKLLLEMYGLPYIQINTESMQERVKLIDSILLQSAVI